MHNPPPISPVSSNGTEHLKPTSLELFTGAGGLALGVHSVGFRHIGLVDWDEFAVETLRDNSRRVLQIDPGLIHHADAGAVDYSSFSQDIDLLAGGPPCQPFSIGGRNLGHADERNMFPLLLDVVAQLRPKAVLVENVNGLLTFSEYLDYILKRLRFPLLALHAGEDWSEHHYRLSGAMESHFRDDEQYIVTSQLVDAANYGVPQRRQRVFITAFRRDLGLDTFQLEPTHGREALLMDQWITGTYWERHGIEPIDYLGRKDKALVERLKKRPIPLETERSAWLTVRDALRDLPEPVSRGAKETFPNHLQHPGARAYPGHTGSVQDYPAKALKAGTHGTPGGENMVRLTDRPGVRYLTIREAARLQTFPDEWWFHGSWAACIKQLGNAVPVGLARLFAEQIKLRLESVSGGSQLEGMDEQRGDGRHHPAPGNPAGARGDRVQALAVPSRAPR
jgi:DNA (cytosine-5)-methyltransferase 1